MRAGKEILALELILSILRTQKPYQVIDDAIETLTRKGDGKTSEALETVKELIAGGEDFVQAFYSAGFLSEATYSYLSVMSSYGGLEPEVLKDYIEDKKKNREIMMKGLTGAVQPALAVVVAVILAGTMIPTFGKIYEEATNPELRPFFYGIYEFIGHHPWIGSLILLVVAVLFVTGLYLAVYRVAVSRERWLAELGSVLLNLHRQYVPYHEIFEFLAGREASDKRRSLYEMIGEASREVSIEEAFEPVLDELPLTLSLVLKEKLRTGEETEAWKLLRDEMRQRLMIKLETLNNFSPVIAYMVVFLLVLFAMVPAFLALMVTLSSLAV